MNDLNYTIDCWALFGEVNWCIDSVYTYISSAKRIYELFGAKDTHYGFSAAPYGVIKGANIGSSRNVAKKVELIYSKDAELTSLEFFSLPKDYNYQYGEYGIYLSRSKDFIVIGYDKEQYPQAPIEAVLVEMREQLVPVWGEHFAITKGHQPLVYCMDRFIDNPVGENLIRDAYVEKLQPIHIIEQFKM